MIVYVFIEREGTLRGQVLAVEDRGDGIKLRGTYGSIREAAEDLKAHGMTALGTFSAPFGPHSILRGIEQCHVYSDLRATSA